MTDRENAGRAPETDTGERGEGEPTSAADVPFSIPDATDPSIDAADIDHDATIEFAFDTGAVAEIVAESVAREIGEIDDGRSRTTLSREEATVSIEIAARDLTALRAAANTWFSLVDVAERMACIGRAVQPGFDGAESQRS